MRLKSRSQAPVAFHSFLSFCIIYIISKIKFEIYVKTWTRNKKLTIGFLSYFPSSTSVTQIYQCVLENILCICCSLYYLTTISMGPLHLVLPFLKMFFSDNYMARSLISCALPSNITLTTRKLNYLLHSPSQYFSLSSLHSLLTVRTL